METVLCVYHVTTWKIKQRNYENDHFPIISLLNSFSYTSDIKFHGKKTVNRYVPTAPAQPMSMNEAYHKEQ